MVTLASNVCHLPLDRRLQALMVAPGFTGLSCNALGAMLCHHTVQANQQPQQQPVQLTEEFVLAWSGLDTARMAAASSLLLRPTGRTDLASVEEGSPCLSGGSRGSLLKRSHSAVVGVPVGRTASEGLHEQHTRSMDRGCASHLLLQLTGRQSATSRCLADSQLCGYARAVQHRVQSP
jgi:hypothetical protein